MKISILSQLFTGTRKIGISSSGLSVNDRGPTYYTSGLSYVSSTAKPKISYAAVALEYLLTGRMSLIENIETNSVFIELYDSATSDTPMLTALYNGSNIHFDQDDIDTSGHIIAPIFAYALSSHSNMEETKEQYKECAKEFGLSSSISDENLYRFCDAFYYEWKNECPTAIDVDGFLDSKILDILTQSIRTGNAQYIPICEETGMGRDLSLSEIEKKTKEELSSADGDGKFKKCKNGDYRLSAFWSMEQQAHIPSPSKLDEFVPSEQFYTLVDLISSELSQVEERLDNGCYGVDAIGNNYINAILVGKPGTGKTTLANALGATFNMPVRTVTVSKNAEEDLYQGMTKVSEGGFKFVETPFLDIYKNGGIILLEEFNLSDPAVLMGALGQAIEKPFILYEDGYKEVRRHPLCVIISTMNTGTQGSREPSEAFTSRSADVFMLDDPDENAFVEILKKNGYPEKDCRKVYFAYSKIISYLTSSSVNAEDVALSVTLRHCLSALRQMKIGRKFKDAIKNTIIGTIAIKDLTLAKMVYENVVETLRD